MPKNNMVLNTYSPKEYLETTLVNEIALLAEKSIKDGSFPFTKEPMARNQNVISGHTLSSIQASQIEIKDAVNGNTEQKWINAADAADAGLVLKSSDKTALSKALKENPSFDTKPLLIAAKTPSLDFQSIYLMNQFTDESVTNALQTNSEGTVRQKVLQSMLVKALTENGTSKEEIKLRNLKRKNFAQNYSSADIKEKTKKTIGKIKETLSLSPAEQKVFYTLHKYFARQNGCDINISNTADEKEFQNALEQLGSDNFAKLMFHASSYTDRCTHYNFSVQPIYSFEQSGDYITKGVYAPNAASIGEAVVRTKSVSRKKSQSPSRTEPNRARSGHNENMGY